jgi:predicted O-methyltransferase YrrM
MTTNQTIIKVKPKAVFSAAEEMFPNENINVISTLPPTGIGSLLTLECAVICAILKIVNPKTIFEIGTFNGSSALLFARNTEDGTKVVTLDLPPDEIEIDQNKKLDILHGSENDDYLKREFKNKGAYYIERAPEEAKRKIVQVLQNSLAFNPIQHKLEGSQELIFIDGGHDYETIKNDTEKSMIMCKKNSVIVWHDYGSNIHVDVEKYLKEKAKNQQIFSVAHTMLAISFQGDLADIQNKIVNFNG